MVLKDWLLLIIPIVFNGVIVFVLQKVFEKKQRIRIRKMEYISILLNKTDNSLNIHAKMTRLANEHDVDELVVNNLVQQYLDSNLDIYYYYIQNKNILKSIECSFEKIATVIMEISKSVHDPSENEDEHSISYSCNKIRDALNEIKDFCIKI